MTFTLFGYTITATFLDGSLVDAYLKTGIFDFMQGNFDTIPAAMLKFSLVSGYHAHTVELMFTLAVATVGALATYVVIRLLGK